MCSYLFDELVELCLRGGTSGGLLEDMADSKRLKHTSTLCNI